jgi:hypothetical protein
MWDELPVGDDGGDGQQPSKALWEERAAADVVRHAKEMQAFESSKQMANNQAEGGGPSGGNKRDREDEDTQAARFSPDGTSSSPTTGLLAGIPKKKKA